MAIEVPITKEISEYEPKLVGPFTARQCICLLFCAPICYVVIRFLSPYLTRTISMFFCFVPAAIAYAFGWARPYGMKMEKFLSSVFVTRFLAPQNRKYKTVNTVETVLDSAEEEWKQAELMKIMETETKKEKKARLKAEKNAKKKKYVLSSLAVK